MYTGTNLRALESQSWLCDALFYLMKTKDYKSITIGQICRQADVSRQTFYNCFHDKDDVVRYAILQRYGIMKDKAASQQYPSGIIDAFSDFFEQNREFLQLLMDHKLSILIASVISEVMEDFLGAVTLGTVNPRTEKYGAAFLSGAISNLLLCWFQDPDRLSKEEMKKFLLQILGGQYYKLNV